MIYFTSDLHFDHYNIIKYCNRPYDSLEEMNEGLVKNWNKIIKNTDEVYILGDFAFHRPIEFAQRLKGKKYLIIGNHDRRFVKDYKKTDVFEWIKDYYELKYNKKKIILCHYAMRVWNHMQHGSYMLFGHSHGSLVGNGRSFDVGVDCHDYKPISIQKVEETMKKLDFEAIDHHGHSER